MEHSDVNSFKVADESQFQQEPAIGGRRSVNLPADLLDKSKNLVMEKAIPRLLGGINLNNIQADKSRITNILLDPKVTKSERMDTVNTLRGNLDAEAFWKLDQAMELKSKGPSTVPSTGTLHSNTGVVVADDGHTAVAIYAKTSVERVDLEELVRPLNKAQQVLAKELGSVPTKVWGAVIKKSPEKDADETQLVKVLKQLAKDEEGNQLTNAIIQAIPVQIPILRAV